MVDGIKNGALRRLFLLLIFGFSLLHAALYDPNKTVTVYVHGFASDGYRQSGIYGEDRVEEFFNNIPLFLGIPTIADPNDVNKPNVVGSTTYYGDTPPPYYTQADIDQIDAVTKAYGGGIPRYALIVAKYAKHLMERTGAKQVNFISGSMGALVTRWLIEKDVEGLASGKKIARWLTIEGVVNGNYAASKSILFKLYDSLEKVSIDIKHMKYDWIADNLSNPRTLGKSPYYKDILIGHETSTNDHPKESLLTKIMLLHGQFQPNDGYQIAGDTAFSDILAPYRFYGQNPTHTYLYATHLGIKDRQSLWAEIGNFMTSNKRVRITLTKAKVDDIHEKNKWYRKKLPAEIIFESRLFSPAANLLWGMSEPVSEQTYLGGVPPIVKYHKKGETKVLSQVLFDDFVLPKESALSVEISLKEIDGDLRYKVYETWKDRQYDKIGMHTFQVPLKAGTYPFSSEKFSGEVKVEVIEYPFALLGEDEGQESSVTQGGGGEDTILEPGELVAFEKVDSKNSAFMQQSLKSFVSQFPNLQKRAIYGVDAYRVIYTTTTKEGEKLNVSGLLTIPQNDQKPLRLISDQHGTLFNNKLAPSQHAPMTTTGAVVSALAGYAVAMPDYIGYGKSSDKDHPYLIKKPLANSVIDMIQASMELLERIGRVYDEKLFLMGYSEGGYATMAALEEIQNSHPQLEVTAAAPMAGAYDLKRTGDFILKQKSYDSPHLPVFLLYSYDRYYNLESLKETFNAPYEYEIENYFAKKREGENPTLTLPKERDTLFKQSFIFLYFTSFPTELKERLVENSLYDWRPSMPIRLYHCEGDKIVPPLNSQIAYSSFLQKGAEQVELIMREGGSHDSCAIPFYLDAIEWFDSF